VSNSVLFLGGYGGDGGIRTLDTAFDRIAV
jgi:hypothetical protein